MNVAGGHDSAPAGRLPLWAWRTIESEWTSYVLLAATVGALALAGLDEMNRSWRLILILLGVLAAVGEAVRGNVLERRRAAKLNTARSAAQAAVAEMSLLLGTLVQPITQLLGEIAGERSKPVRQKLCARLIEKVVDAASGICGPNELGSTRAVYFELVDGQLRFCSHNGREERPRSEMPSGAVDLAISRQPVLVPDVVQAPNPEDFANASYKTFISCPVYADGTVYGLLTVDSLELGSLTKHDLRAATVLAHLLGTGISIANGPR